MKIKLIAPHEQREDTSNFRLQRVNLPLIAALTPPGHTITMVDEVFAPDDLNQEVDLVGITVMTDLVPRAYQYRRHLSPKGGEGGAGRNTPHHIA